MRVCADSIHVYLLFFVFVVFSLSLSVRICAAFDQRRVAPVTIAGMDSMRSPFAWTAWDFGWVVVWLRFGIGFSGFEGVDSGWAQCLC